uniref:VASt domain-containing protein n=1 Tax=Auxenochlorella protothecoides TaxID=3075 RepID=A0A1D2AAN3_AUXPR
MVDGEVVTVTRWPDDAPGTQLLSIRVDKSVDDLFLLAYGSSTDFTTQLHAAVGNREVVASDWRTSTNQLSTSADTNTPPALGALRPGWVRRVRFLGTSMGSAFKTVELQQLEEARPGAAYRLEVCVSTTATYGDKFRPVLRHTLAAAGPGASVLTISATVVFVGKVNGFIKGMIERGARDGMVKNYAAFRKTLQGFATVTDAAPGEGLGPSVPGAAPVPEPAAGALPAPGLLVTLFGSELVEATAPWAQAAQGLPGLATLGSPVLQGALCTLCALSLLQFVVQVLAFLHRASRDPQDTVSGLAHVAFKVIPVPESSGHVLAAAGILLAVRAMLGALAGVIPAPPPLGAAAPAAADAAPPAPQEPAPGGTPAPAPVEAEGQSEGVKYEGYAEAIAIAQGQIQAQSNSRSFSSLLSFPWASSPAALPPAPFANSTPDKAVPTPDASPAKSVTSTGPGSVPGTPGTNPAPQAILEGLERGESETDVLAERLMSPRGRARDLLGPTSRQAGGQAVMEEVFENERLQPFRGWGHTWPGHFLPTDRVNRWSLREVPGKPLVASQEFKRVVPRVQQGWRWLESTWHLDLSGQLVDAVDADGWAYGLDFGWLVFPFPEGGGQKKYSDFVRRRRWIRMRVPVEEGLGGDAAPAEGDEAVLAAEPRGDSLLLPGSSASGCAGPIQDSEGQCRALAATLAAAAVAAALSLAAGERGREPLVDAWPREGDGGHVGVDPGPSDLQVGDGETPGGAHEEGRTESAAEPAAASAGLDEGTAGEDAASVVSPASSDGTEGGSVAPDTGHLML